MKTVEISETPVKKRERKTIESLQGINRQKNENKLTKKGFQVENRKASWK